MSDFTIKLLKFEGIGIILFEWINFWSIQSEMVTKRNASFNCFIWQIILSNDLRFGPKRMKYIVLCCVVLYVILSNHFIWQLYSFCQMIVFGQNAWNMLCYISFRLIISLFILSNVLHFGQKWMRYVVLCCVLAHLIISFHKSFAFWAKMNEMCCRI